MDTELKSYLNTLDEILTEAERKTKSSSIEMLNWQPHARDVNSIAAILTHMHGVASFWIFQALTGEDVNRNRAIEFQAIISDRNEVPTLLHQARIRIQKAIGNCTHSDLDVGHSRVEAEAISHHTGPAEEAGVEAALQAGLEAWWGFLDGVQELRSG